MHKARLLFRRQRTVFVVPHDHDCWASGRDQSVRDRDDGDAPRVSFSVCEKTRENLKNGITICGNGICHLSSGRTGTLFFCITI